MEPEPSLFSSLRLQPKRAATGGFSSTTLLGRHFGSPRPILLFSVLVRHFGSPRPTSVKCAGETYRITLSYYCLVCWWDISDHPVLLLALPGPCGEEPGAADILGKQYAVKEEESHRKKGKGRLCWLGEGIEWRTSQLAPEWFEEKDE